MLCKDLRDRQTSESSKGSPAGRVENFLCASAPKLIAVRRHLHQHPELSGAEHATTAFLSAELSAAGIAHSLGPGRRGIITRRFGALRRETPVVALRADIDALPIAEENDVPYRSSAEGVMHACGHDAHSAMVLGALLGLHLAPPAGAGVRGIFQPSEEAGHGARDMVKAGAVDGVDAIVALHVDPTLPAGSVALRPGPQTAHCQDFSLEVVGRGGHGARPHNTVDPIAIASQLVSLIYQGVPRRTDARDPVVVTIGEFHAGHAANVIPDTARLKGTIRAFDSHVARNTRRLIEQICRGVALASRARVRATFDEPLNGVTNDPRVTAICEQAARSVVGASRVLTDGRPSMGAEDFADYLERVPGCMIRIGVKSPRIKATPLHTSRFDVEESALLVGARLLARVLFDWPGQPRH